ncbi:sensor histidine kinase [Caldalkalibacillus salinus]|uniref:sensor histidine kinase n=1 Tax=Caldalkalibacillus salinus TaxID=2803787 RepID=UPI001922F5C7|nr:HAMP domain-containing sensor histidine kinase [Caldalkalibacillus salinus]
MSIRKRLVLSNIAMVVIPILFFVLTTMLLVSIFFGDVRGFWQDNHTGDPERASVNHEMVALKKVASLTPEQLENPDYLSSVNDTLMEDDTALIVRKGDELTFVPPHFDSLSPSDLPPFGAEQSQRPVQSIGAGHFYMQTYDYFYPDGTEGTLFLLRDPGATANVARQFFPLLFGSLILILIMTNGLLTYFVSKSILQPVNDLMRAAQEMSNGNLDFHIKPKKKDELGQLAQAFEHMRQKLKASTALQIQYEENRKELISNISHDLKTPITSIKGHVEGILDGVANTPDKMKRYLQNIHTKSTDMDRLIDELALYSKLDLKRLPFHFEEVNLKAFLTDVLEELTVDFEDEGVALSFHAEKAPSNTSYDVIMDREQIKRVVVNVIHNSLKYMEKDEKKIRVRLKEHEDQVIVNIQDNGPGIPEEALPYVFDRFYRVDTSRNTKTGGSGLGLAIAKRILEEHRGDMWVESIVGEGTSVFFMLKKTGNG